jgi:FkbM family methyltransferase
MKTRYKIILAKIIYKILKIFISKIRYVKRNNIKWKLDLSEGIDLSIFMFGTSEKKIYNLKKIFKKNSKLIFLDIGANIGSVSLPLARIFDNSYVYSIEPTSYAFRKLKTNFSLNPSLSKKIFLTQAFISTTKKPKKVWSRWKLNEENNQHKDHKGKLKSIQKASTITLSNFIKKNKIQKVDFIKLDVDGYELDVLKSGKDFLKKNKPIIFIEIAPYLYKEFGYSYIDLIDYIHDLGYNFYNEDLKKIYDIKNITKKINHGTSKNFYLL